MNSAFVTLTAVTAPVLAGATVPDSSLITGILTSAGAGTALMVVLLLTGWLWTRHSVDDIKAQRDSEHAERLKAEDQRDEALKLATDKILPLLASFTATTSVLIPLLQNLVARQEDVKRGR